VKNIISKAAKYESKESLDGAMKFLKGNVTMPKQEKTPMTRPMPKSVMGISKIAPAKKAVKVAKVVKAAKAIKKMC